MSYQSLADVPPFDPQPFIRRVRDDEALEWFFLSDKLAVHEVHWGPGRTVGHWCPREECIGCALHWPIKIITYASVIRAGSAGLEIIELPHESSERMLRILGCRDGLRGMHIRAWRKGGKRGTVQFELKRHFRDYSENADRQLPVAQDVGHALEKIWEINLKRLKLQHSDVLADFRVVG